MRLTPSTFGPLAPYLLELAGAFEAVELRLMLVGGFGLVLRRQWREQQDEQTLIEAVPPARATEDFDALLKLSVLEDAKQRLAVRQILTTLGYQVKGGMEYLHFVKPDSSRPGKSEVKVDFLAPPVPPKSSTLKESSFRVGSKISTQEDKLHGYKTPEAALLMGNLLTVPLEGVDTNGLERQVQVDLPHPFLLTLMKLRAFRDEYEGKRGMVRRAAAAKHIADMYTLIALLTQTEAEDLMRIAEENSSHAVVQDAIGIIVTLLGDDQAAGTLLLRETLTISADDLSVFLDLLNSSYHY